MTRTSRKGSLLEVYGRMLERYGSQHWWPGETRFEMMVGAVLTQAAAWTNVRKALANLVSAAALSPRALRELDERDLANLIHSSGYFNSKARKLKSLVAYLGRRFDDDLDAMAQEDSRVLRRELLDVYGIGEETADDIMLYALEKPTFVVDKYTRRIFSRLAMAPGSETYSAYREMFMGALPADPALRGEYHALIVRHGKDACRTAPRCQGCCLLDLCPTGKKLINAQAEAAR